MHTSMTRQFLKFVTDADHAFGLGNDEPVNKHNSRENTNSAANNVFPPVASNTIFSVKSFSSSPSSLSSCFSLDPFTDAPNPTGCLQLENETVSIGCRSQFELKPQQKP